jgi:hypothetical protein
VTADARPEPTSRRRSPGACRAAVALIVVTAVCASWYRSRTRADVFVVFAHNGNVGGVRTVRGQVLAVFSNIDLGEPWTAVADSQPAVAGEALREFLLESPTVTQRWGFVAARHPADAFTIPGKWCSALGAPHWVLVPPPAYVVTAWGIRRLRDRRRRRAGRCVACGYDLRGAGGTCPECGGPTHIAGRPGSPSDAISPMNAGPTPTPVGSHSSRA